MNDYKSDYALRGLRNMAWERAKGEIRGMLQTYYTEDYSSSQKSRYEKMNEAFDNFVKYVEDEGLNE